MYELEVDTKKIHTMSEHIDTKTKSMEMKLEELENAVKNLRASWNGEGAESFFLSFQKSIAEIDWGIKKLKRMSYYENNAEELYKKCKGKIEEHLSRL